MDKFNAMTKTELDEFDELSSRTYNKNMIEARRHVADLISIMIENNIKVALVGDTCTYKSYVVHLAEHRLGRYIRSYHIFNGAKKSVIKQAEVLELLPMYADHVPSDFVVINTNFLRELEFR